ncbi:MAG: hypothetical protein IKS34_05500 [Clostridia bacterium]|nr:hypothetical protein [Clostridia bacterium]MBR4467742.1 hypothetical protein [Clostridia bacterium]
MRQLQFLKEYVDEFTYNNNPTEEKQIRLETSLKFTVRFAEKNDLVIGDATIIIDDAGHEGIFRIKFHHLSQFHLESPVTDEAGKKSVHMEASQILYPLWSSILRSFCASVNIPVIQLPPYRVSEDKIQST